MLVYAAIQLSRVHFPTKFPHPRNIHYIIPSLFAKEHTTIFKEFLDISFANFSKIHEIKPHNLYTFSSEKILKWVFIYIYMKSHVYYKPLFFSKISIKIWNYWDFLKEKVKSIHISYKIYSNNLKFSPYVYTTMKNIWWCKYGFQLQFILEIH